MNHPRLSNFSATALKIGVMQGRLLPKINGRYQAHPTENWMNEFLIASDLHLDLIEFILDHENYENNPLMTVNGCNQIAEISKQTGVLVTTVCADCFMEAPLHSADSRERSQSRKILNSLISNAPVVGVTDIVLPLVDKSSIFAAEERRQFIGSIKPILRDLDTTSPNICLESDLPPREILELVSDLDSPKITINYDCGNSASLKFDPIEELSVYGKLITDVHIKDRKHNGPSVILGTGDANFTSVLQGLKYHYYSGPLILQAFRDEDGLGVFKQQLSWFRDFLINFDQA